MPKRIASLAGKTFSSLTVLHEDCRTSLPRYWKCRCTCGNETVILQSHLRNGHTRSCGCLRDKVAGELKTTHGKYGTPEYITWGGMIQRCTNPNSPGYPDYGGRGITVCSRWRKFENFFEDMGNRPSGMSIDRINNNGNYEPSNCRWATDEQQRSNRRCSRRNRM